MFLIVHASVGAALGSQLENPATAFGTGFLSHFVVDMIPHGDEIIDRTILKSRRTGWLAILAALDCAAAFSLVMVFWASGLYANAVGEFSGAFGAVLPDVLQGLSELSHGRLWPEFAHFHERNHRALGLQVPLHVGASIQAATLILLTLFLTSVPIAGVMASR